MAIPYVKFERGTVAAYNTLKTNNRLNSDTLYFIYEDSTAETGKLYLGTKLISGSEVSLSDELTNLDSILKDAGASKFLITDSDGLWKVASSTEVAGLLNISGADISYDENLFEADSGDLSLLNFDEADNGALLTKVNGKVSWVVPSTELATKVGTLETAVNTLKDTTVPALDTRVGSLETRVGAVEDITNNLNSTILTAIAGANHLTYKKVENLSAVTESNVIYLVPKDETETNNGFDEFMVVDGSAEKLGSFDVNLDGYVSTSTFNTTVGTLATKEELNDYVSTSTFNTTVGNLATLTALNAVDAKFSDYVTTMTFNTTVGSLSDFNAYDEDTMSSIIDEINYINEKLIWQELSV